MNTQLDRRLKYAQLNICVLMVLACAWSVRSATPVAGDVSGTWTTNGSPYVVVLHSTVVAGGSLTIEPGVTVILGTDVRLWVEGRVTAVGRIDAPITFRGTSPTTYWEAIRIAPGNASTNSYTFKHCRFSESRDSAISFNAQGRSRAQILNCKFSNCLGNGVFASVADSPSGSELDFSIRNCTFESLRDGCVLATYGPNVTLISSIANCLFRDLRETACRAVNVNANVPATIHFVNNTVLRAPMGILTEDPNDTVVRNNIFSQTGIALKRTGSRSLTAAYNCFFNNGTNFQGYPGVYGSIVTANRNGDPSDVFSNILLNPQFTSSPNLLVAANSPCIDAGDPGVVDSCFELSMGTSISDIGAYGGPDACGWKDVLFAPIGLGIQAYAGLSITGIPGQVYCIEFRDGFDINGPWTPLTTNFMTNSTWLFVDTTTPLHARRFYRVRLKP